ncbi:YncE family protein [Kitasatospora camelliae]|uniref:YncE family protein n=1 Tax=Kitasatospora camelliae TaxID=3156397 RepID=A0AAU8K389_9ACTN
MPASPARRRSALLGALLALALAAPTTALADTPAPSAGTLTATAATDLRDVLLVGNGQGGTVSFIDGHGFTNLGSFDAVPDLEQRVAEMNLVERAAYEIVNAAQGYRKLVDDIALGPDGRTLYVSRGALSDAVAFDIPTRTMLWRHRVVGFKADHAALSPDGTRFVVSATTAAKAEVLDTATGRPVTAFATGTYPHANDYSPDGTVLYNSSIGVTGLPKALEWAKGPRQVTAVDATTYRPLRTYTFDHGVRPAVFTPDNRTMYAQLSYLNGFVEYDLAAGRITRTVQLPFSDKAARLGPDDYPQNSAHHGMALSGDQTRLCVAGTIDDYTAVVSRPGLTVDGYVHYEPDALPYWTATSADGRTCFVSLANRDQISVVDYATATEIARIPTGRFPQRQRLGRITPTALAALSPRNG